MDEFFHESAIEICNKALSNLSQDTPIADLSLTAENIKDRKCAMQYNTSRLTVLRAVNWNFAKRREPVQSYYQDASDSVYPYRAVMPAGVARLIECLGDSGEPVKYVIFSDVIHSAEPIRNIIYTEDVDDIEQWHTGAKKCLIFRLTADIAKPITGRMNEVQLWEDKYERCLKAESLQEARESGCVVDAYHNNFYAEVMLGRKA